MNKPTPANPLRLSTDYPELGTAPLDITRRFTSDYFDLERTKIFSKTWLWLAMAYDLPNPGDYVVKELEHAKASIILVRGNDNQIRGFHNSCSHRTNRVAYAPSGNAPKGFTCRFHGWNYGTDGTLNFVPQDDLFPELDLSCNGLTPVATDLWEGSIFINLDPEPEETLAEFLGEFANSYAGFFDGMEQACAYSVEVNANWKICIDAFVETYHFAFVHQSTAAGVLTSKDNPYGRLEICRLYDKHRVVSARANTGYTPTPTEAVIASLGMQQTLNPDFAQAAENRLPEGINPAKLNDWATDILVLFPGTVIYPWTGWFEIMNFIPVSHNKTRWEMRIGMQPATNAGTWLSQEYNSTLIRDVVRQDWTNLEMIQQNIESGAKKEMHLGDQEIMLRHQYDVVDRYINSK
ncbi:MAG: aromatic ring-hydroxylating dioxygenase subunit alpha [Gammaproteobacteria bacterium]|nr:aromatic ring-hydroxylating dioxygenase subunit alpha [Gammaproteobacteria bacterium]